MARVQWLFLVAGVLIALALLNESVFEWFRSTSGFFYLPFVLAVPPFLHHLASKRGRSVRDTALVIDLAVFTVAVWLLKPPIVIGAPIVVAAGMITLLILQHRTDRSGGIMT